MKVILAHTHYNDEHLARVVEEMRTLGSPKIRAVWQECWGAWVALEGCHRLRACEVLGIVPEIIPIELVDGLTTDDIGMSEEFDGDAHLVEALVDRAWESIVLQLGSDE